MTWEIPLPTNAEFVALVRREIADANARVREMQADQPARPKRKLKPPPPARKRKPPTPPPPPKEPLEVLFTPRGPMPPLCEPLDGDASPRMKKAAEIARLLWEHGIVMVSALDMRKVSLAEHDQSIRNLIIEAGCKVGLKVTTKKLGHGIIHAQVID